MLQAIKSNDDIKRENELFPFTDDEDNDLKPNRNSEDVVNGNEYEDYTSNATSDYSIDGYGQDLDNDDGLSDYNSDSNHDKVVSSEDEEEVDYMKGLSKRLYKDYLSGNVELKDDYVIQKGFEIHRKKNERTRVTTVCKAIGCTWCIHASPTPTMSLITYMIKSYNNEHICTKARHKAKEVVEGKHVACYGKLRRYENKVLKSNSGSIVKIQVDRNLGYPILKRFFICFASMRDGFVNGCRPFIGVYGCFLKRSFEGQLLTVISLDSSSERVIDAISNIWNILRIDIVVDISIAI
ncbi:hypothetical protein ACFX2I_012226 [Malus domestica]